MSFNNYNGDVNYLKIKNNSEFTGNRPFVSNIHNCECGEKW